MSELYFTAEITRRFEGGWFGGSFSFGRAQPLFPEPEGRAVRLKEGIRGLCHEEVNCPVCTDGPFSTSDLQEMSLSTWKKLS